MSNSKHGISAAWAPNDPSSHQFDVYYSGNFKNNQQSHNPSGSGRAGSLVNQESSADSGLSEYEFYFQPKVAKIDWKALRKIKVKQMIKDSEVELLPLLMPNLTMSRVDMSFLQSPSMLTPETVEDFSHFGNNEYLVKFFKLLQYANEFSANQLKVTQSVLKQTEMEYQRVYSQLNDKAEVLKHRQQKLKKAKEAAIKKNALLTR